MGIAILSALGFIYGLYALLLLSISYVIGKVNKTRHSIDRNQKVSIDLIVPFRNEEHVLPSLLTAISMLKYDHSQLKIYLMDDHSSDRSSEVFDQYKKSIPFHLEVIGLPAHLVGKKMAMKYGVSQGRGELIVFTDADCAFNDLWLSTYREAYLQNRFDFAFGAVHVNGEGPLGEYQKTEQFALTGISMGMALLNKPILTSAANMCVCRAFLEGDLADEDWFGAKLSPSGDDLFLLQNILKFKGKVSCITNTDAVVVTLAAANFIALFQQKLRWASKWNKIYNPYFILVGLLILMVNFSSIVLFYYLFTWGSYLPFVLVSIALKAAVEYVLIDRVVNLTRKKFKKSSFVWLFLIYPFYTFFFFLSSNFYSFDWKGRKSSSI